MNFLDFLFATIKQYANKSQQLANFVTITDNYEQTKDLKYLNILEEYMDTTVEYFKDKPSFPEFVELLNVYNVLMFIYKHIYCNQHLDTIMMIKPIITKSNLNQDIIIEQLSMLFSQNILSFPWKKLFMGDPDIRFINLVNYTPNYTQGQYRFKNLNFHSQLIPLNFQGNYITFVTSQDDYDNMDVITDFFQEQQRLKARRQDQAKSPLETWYNKEFQLQFLPKVLNEKGKLDTENLREAFYNEIKEATLFKPSLVVSVIKTFEAKKMLDFSAGWGDRLIGGIAADLKEYQAYDPNTNLKKGHQEMIKRYVPIDKRSNFKIDYIPFEQANLPDNYFDLVFTSPPFFDFEIYTDLPGQSTLTYVNVNDWIVNFLFKSMQKSYNALKDQGYMVIHITDVYKTRVVEPMVLLVKSQINNLNYLGVIASKSETNIDRPMWVFQKDQSHKNDEQSANSALQTYYPGVYFKVNNLNIQQTLNPDFIFSTAQYQGKNFEVVRDDYLPAGTKQRALALYLDTFPEYNEFIYVSPPNGYAQVALAYVANILGKHGTIIVSKLPRQTDLTQKAIDLGATVIEKPGGMKVLREYANNYIKNKPKTKILPFGLDDQVYINLLASQIREKWPIERQPTVFWLVAGSGTILRALHKVFPSAFYNIVQVGKEVYPDIVDRINHKLYIAPEHFKDDAKQLPPYPSVSTYDAKLWQFAQQYGKSGDYIWNVAKN